MISHDSRHLSMIVSHAAHHLHAVVGHCSTALIDTSGPGRFLFSNSALSHLNGKAIFDDAQHYAQLEIDHGSYPSLHMHDVDGDTRAYFSVLDDRHVFVIVGRPSDELRVQAFNERLKHLLPSVVG